MKKTIGLLIVVVLGCDQVPSIASAVDGQATTSTPLPRPTLEDCIRVDGESKVIITCSVRITGSVGINADPDPTVGLVADGKEYGLRGITSFPEGAGVDGVNSSEKCPGAGVRGKGYYGLYADKSTVGIYGRGEHQGVYGFSENGTGVYAIGDNAAVYGVGKVYGFFGTGGVASVGGVNNDQLATIEMLRTTLAEQGARLAAIEARLGPAP